MIVYADRKKTRPTREVLQEMRRLRGIDLLIVFGQLESGVVDALSPDEDVTNPAVRALRFRSPVPGWVKESLSWALCTRSSYRR